MTELTGEEVLKRIADAGRRVFPSHEFMAEADPEALAAYNSFLETSIYRNGALDDSMKEILLACLCITIGSSAPVITNHFRRAMAAGATKEAMLQAVQITACVGATKPMSTGLSTLMEALSDD